jgi:hypothetical protein
MLNSDWITEEDTQPKISDSYEDAPYWGENNEERD